MGLENWKKIVKEKFSHLNDGIYSLFQPEISENHIDFVGSTPNVTIEDVILGRLKSLSFKWENRGNKIGVTFDRDFFSKKLEKIKSTLKDEKTRKEFYENNHNSAFSNNNNYILNTYPKVISALEKYLAKKDNFIEIAEIPEELYWKKIANNQSIPILTVSLYDRQGKTDFTDEQIAHIQQALTTDFPLPIHFLDKDSKYKPSFRIACSETGKSFFSHASAEVDPFNLFIKQEISITFDKNLFYQKNINNEFLIHVLFHEMMHLIGFSDHPWDDPVPEGKYEGMLETKFLAFDTHYTHPLCHETFLNGAYATLRKIFNKTVRSVTRAVIETAYDASQPSHADNVTYILKPEKNKTSYEKKISVKNGERIEEYSGNLSNITLHNNSTISNFDFRFIKAFETIITSLKKQPLAKKYAKGVTTILVDKGKSVLFKATFETYQPTKIDEVIRHRDHNLDMSLTSKQIETINYSDTDDIGYFSTNKKTILYPHKGNDEFHFVNGKKYQIYLFKDDGYNKLNFCVDTGGIINLPYPKKDLITQQYGEFQSYYIEKQTKNGIEKHGVRIKNCQLNNPNVLVKDCNGVLLNF